MSAFIDAHRERFGVELICRTIGCSASAYYRRATAERSARDVADERLVGVIRALHEQNYCAYGYRRMWKALLRAGERVGRGHVQRLMAAEGIQGAKRRRRPWRTTTPDPTAQRAADLVERDFTAEAPNRLFVADFTYLRRWEGLVFFAFVLDVFSRMVVGWQLASHMRTELVQDALRMALHLRGPGADVALVHHSDRAGLARFLALEGVEVIEVTGPARRGRRHLGKSDARDAEAAARAVLSGEATAVPKPRDGIVESIRVLRHTRASAVKSRTQAGLQLAT